MFYSHKVKLVEELQGLDNSMFYGNVKEVTTKEFFYDVELENYYEAPDCIEVKTFSETGKILSRSNKYSRRWGDVMGFDLEDSSVKYFYDENALLTNVIFYDEGLKINRLIEYFYESENKLSLIKSDRITYNQFTEFQYYDRKLLKILTNSVTGEVKRDIILYDNHNRIISEESIFKKLEGNYPVKNPSKKYYYDNDSFITEHYFDNKITSTETKLNNGKLVNRTNYDENGKLFSIVNVLYSNNIITTVCNSGNDHQIFKTIQYLDQNQKVIRRTTYKNGDILDAESIIKYDEFNNCIYDETIDFSRTTTDYEYQ